MPKKNKFKMSSSGDKKSTKKTSGITQSHNSDSFTSVGQESFEIWQRVIQDIGEVSKLNEPDTVHSIGVAVVEQFGHSDSIIQHGVSGMDQIVKNKPYQLWILPIEIAFPRYAVLSARKESFKTWPKYIPVKSKDLAEAGFFYGGVGDTVKCYSCGGGLRYWKSDDEPWTEHAKWYPRCLHLVLIKGPDFIKEIKTREKGEFSRGTSLGKDDTGVVSKPKESDLMDSPAVAAVREFVDNETVIRQAVEYMIKHSKGIQNITAQDLIEIVEVIEEGKTSNRVVAETGETIFKLEPGSTGVSNIVLEGNADNEKNQMENERLCKFCLKAKTRVMFMPCGHCMSCPQCAPALNQYPELL